ncbi:hypothetical protein OF829_01120 [Sphingomonas sp. LB-2]|uniref:hypothetical protein n=1 Tax=Sphingomonas caeni TaxID=2984949 RepID=UPI002231D1D8|nr:hypothetical protein [Sphingomonas caeni]MCW3845823.1 hypothetical protein [Sphingomonas caeni]
MGFPTIPFALLQGLLVAVLMLSVPMVMAFCGRLKMSGGDLLLLIPIYPALALLSVLVFLPFEGNWADVAFGPLGALRALIVGGLFLVLGTLVTQRHQLPKLDANGIVHRLSSVFVIGAVWGVVWSLSGWLLTCMGMMSNG